ncbi:hypothetical protein GCM10010339_25440 [Streptomyces alanosinicus]|uniref:Uncharacterized protein n=1 Tax=Streptomyces alanosinicus TaxID=68171 RepID=A0A918YGR0_9ACTN|nr:hypothetical protein GCM10010339_25440 [Streptomyces alanosinicus]
MTDHMAKLHSAISATAGASASATIRARTVVGRPEGQRMRYLPVLPVSSGRERGTTYGMVTPDRNGDLR